MNRKLLLAALLVISLIPVASFATTRSFTFSDSLLTGPFSGSATNYSILRRNNGGNDFPGSILRGSEKLLDSNTTVVLDNSNRSCARQVRGYYYNPLRGNRIRPLDADSLARLQAIDSSYNNLTIEGGRYKNCTNQDSSYIYGEIRHKFGSGIVYKLLAGVTTNTNSNSYAGEFSDGATIAKNIGSKIFDSVGGIGRIYGTDTSPAGFSFNPVINVTPHVRVESQTVLLSGFTDGVTLSVTNGFFRVNSGSTLRSGSYVVYPGDTVTLSQYASSYFNTTVKVLYTLAGTDGEWDITTRVDDGTSTGIVITGATDGPRAGLPRYTWYFKSNRTFTDVQNTYYQSAIEYMANFSIVNGNGKGKYYPDNFTRLSDIIVMIENAKDLYLNNPLVTTHTATSSPFSDVSTSRNDIDNINKAYNDGLLAGLYTTTNGQMKLNPNRFVSVNDVTKMIANVIAKYPTTVNTYQYNRLGTVGRTLRRGETVEMIMRTFFTARVN